MWCPIALLALLACEPASTPTPSPPRPALPAPAPKATGLAGSAACQSCHPDAYRLWSATRHARAERPIDPTRDPGLQQGKLPDGLTPHRAIGDRPLIQYLVEAPGGRLQAHSEAWDVARQEWFSVFDDPRAPGDWGHWTGRGLNWNSMCADCHNTQVRAGYDVAADTYHTAIGEVGVGCEACHGEGAAHAQDPQTALTPITPDTCAPCHARRSALTAAPPPGAPFLAHFLPSYRDLGPAWLADGRAREENFEWATFASSRMASQGVTCLSCHDPHQDFATPPGDALCNRCHERMPGFEPHAFHPAGQPGGQCVDCHMPATTYMGRHPRRDHGFTVPDPILAQETGEPDACASCHADWPADRLRTAWEEAYGAGDRPRRAVPRAIHLARQQAPDAAAALLRALPGAAPAERASLASCLGPWAHLPEVGAALSALGADPDPLVRLGAVRAWSEASELSNESRRRALAPFLNDPVRAIRVQAAEPLRAGWPPNSGRLADYAEYVQLHRDQPSGALAFGAWLLERGEAQAALRDLDRAVSWDPNSAGLRHTYALALAQAGQPQLAAEQLRRGVQAEPDQPVLTYALALAEAAAGQPEAALASLRRTVELDPSHARAWYNLGLLLHQLGRSTEGLEALERAIPLDQNGDALYAKATLLRDLQRLAEAEAAANELLRRWPSRPDGPALIRSLSAPTR